MPTAHERLVSYLDVVRSPVNFSVQSGTRIVILELPSEVLDLIFLQLPNKHEVANACKVNRRFYATGMRVLYKKLQLTVTNTVDPKLAQLFSSSNAGLPFVQEVYAMATGGYNGNNAASQWMSIFANQLPKDKLTTFALDASQSINTRNVQTLWQRQRALKHLDIGPTYVEAGDENNGIDLLLQLNNLQLQELRSVRIVVDSTETAALGCLALQHGRVRKLEVNASIFLQDLSAQSNVQDNWDNGEPMEDALTDTLFDHIDRVQPGLPGKHTFLQDLTLSDVDLKACKETWFTYLDLSGLKHLSLQHCNGADIFLMRISPGATTPGLRTFSILREVPARGEDRTISSIEELLKYPRNTLKKLEIVVRNAPRLPQVGAVRQHGATLRTLIVDVVGHVAMSLMLVPVGFRSALPTPSRMWKT
jgi:hypothetical protein